MLLCKDTKKCAEERQYSEKYGFPKNCLYGTILRLRIALKKAIEGKIMKTKLFKKHYRKRGKEPWEIEIK